MTRHFLTPLLCILLLTGRAQDLAELVVSTGHTESVTCLEFSHDNRYLASGSYDKLVKIYDLEMMTEFRTLVGHNERIYKVLFSYDDSYIITIGYDAILVWSHPDGKLIHTIKEDIYEGGSVDVTETGKLLICDDGLKVFDLVTGELEQHFEDIEGSACTAINGGTQVIAQTWQDKIVVALFDLTTGEVIRTFDQPNTTAYFNPTRFIVDPDETMVATEPEMGSVAIWNLETGEIQTQYSVSQYYLSGMEFTPDGKFLATTGFDNTLRFVNAKNGKVQEEITALEPATADVDPAMVWYMNVDDVTFSEDGNMYAVPYSVTGVEGAANFIRLYDPKNHKPLGAFTGQRKYFSKLAVDATGEYLIANVYGTINGVRVWNIKEGELQRYYGPSALSFINENTISRWTYDMDALTPAIEFLDLPSFESRGTLKIGSGGVSTLSSDNKYYATMEMDPDYDMNSGAMPDMYINIYDVESGEIIYGEQYDIMSSPQTLTFSLDNTKLYVIYQYKITTIDVKSGKASTEEGFESINGFYQYDMHPDGVHIAFTENVDYEIGCRIRLIDPSDASADTYFETGEWAMAECLRYSPDGRYVALGMRVFDAERIYQVWVYDVETSERVCELLGHTTDLMQIAWAPDGLSLFSGDQSGTIKMWDMEECTNVVSFIAMDDLDYIIVTPDNYYKSSKGNFEGVAFRYQNELYSFDQFDLVYNRPDLVMEQIGYSSSLLIKMYKMAYDKRLSRMGFTEDMLSADFHTPELDITNVSDLPLSTPEETISVAISASDSRYDLNRLNVYVNDVPAFGRNGMEISTGSNYEGNIELTLSEGVNKIQVSAMNETGIESIRETFEIRCDKSTTKPDLYLMAVGVSQYEDSQRNLTFPTKDVNDLVSTLESSKKYENIYVEKILDSEATRDNIVTTSAFMNEAGVDDHVMIYYSSHGLLDDNLDYFLATYDVEFEDPATKGLPYEAIDDMLDQSAARNRLVMIDACHSGEVDKEEAVEEQVVETNVSISFKGSTMIKPKAGLQNSFSYMQALFTDVSKGTGATVISAAGGYEFALESAEWSNGVFTYSVLDGLTSMKADVNGDGTVNISELRNFIIDRVHDLTNGAQTPTARKVNELNDFSIY